MEATKVENRSNAKPAILSATLIFNFGLILGGMFAPKISDAVRTILITTGAANMGLRLKTKGGIRGVFRRSV